MSILDILGKRLFFIDGGMGTLLQREGLAPGELPELWNITHRDIIVGIHKRYYEVGCDMVITNTFGANGLKFSEGEHSVEEIITAAVGNARQAADEMEKATGRPRYVALDLGPTGKLLKPLGDLSFDQAVELYAQQVKAGVKAGVDCCLIETISDTYELKAAVLAAKENSNLPIFASVTFDEKGKLLTGGDPASVTALLEGLRVNAIGMNCGLGPSQMKKNLQELVKYTSLPIFIMPNAGLPKSVGGETVFNVHPNEFAREMKDMAEMGVWALGGCCGTTPEHIQAMIEVCKDILPKALEDKKMTLVSSFGRAVEIGKSPIIIGERINPTGKSRLKQALRDKDMDYILGEGLKQQEKGAHILDVNVGLPDIQEDEMMELAVTSLQSVTDLPLQIDTSDTNAMERAMRVYNGKPLINSVNGKQESMDAVFPLVKKYGGVVVGLALDEVGIPETAEGRLAVAQKIVENAAKYGITAKDILIDGLAMTISSDSQGAQTTLKTIAFAKEKLGVGTVLGVSNISFGLPQREIVNAAFYTMAMQKGLSAAIINPNSEAMMRSYYAFKALAGLDAQCMDYITHYSGQTQEAPKTQTTELTLFEAIEKGLKDRAHQIAEEKLKTEEPLGIINTEMIPALDKVGKGFEKGTLFLPQLLMSAEAAKAAFDAIKISMDKSGKKQEKKGKIVLATVKGDIHDIGKNIVKVLLENYSYDVIDLGKDIDPQLIVDTVIEQKVNLAGLSALMTTTVANMEITIQSLHEHAPWCKIMVGGAVLTPEYADSIGADHYSKDAMSSVYYAQEILG